ncbi:hypothetical protein [Limnovirga soli]|uniref:Uncharacterized protein n=1 Tax=Limnovirga soli TaxID=2656915 RepID=A0A8J8JTG3_9BACT|nr:hypothetical protein [Limnovirga soli]NNV55893.1 hypothetical protein [Limnovirga soli]
MQTTVAPSPVTLKNITWETNYNNKMGCLSMLHIDIKPSRMPQQSVIENTIIEIATADNSYPPTRYKLHWLQPMLLNNVPELVTYPSHAMSYVEFYKFLRQKYGPNICGATEMCVYYYLRCV